MANVVYCEGGLTMKSPYAKENQCSRCGLIKETWYSKMPKSKQEHTPGPWSVTHQVYTDGTYDIIGEGKVIAHLGGCLAGNDTGEANAALIAAAPDLLDLIKRLNYAFYVDGTSKAMKPIMAETKAIIQKCEVK